MSQATFHFHGNLNDFIAPARRHITFTHTFVERSSVKDLIESIGAPHTEVEAIVVDGASVDFTYLAHGGEHIDVFPIFEPVATTPLVPLRPPLPSDVTFVLDTHLGQLAVYLRMLGFDTLYRNDYGDEELARVSSNEGRILLTRDRGLLKRGIVTFGYYMRETNPERQVGEALRRFSLFDVIQPFRRCVRCNGLLHPVSKEQVVDRVSPTTLACYDSFHACDSCSQIYWKGSHYEHMRQFIERVMTAQV
jgi:hypothetical protein